MLTGKKYADMKKRLKQQKHKYAILETPTEHLRSDDLESRS